MKDQHTAMLALEDGYLAWRVRCPYSKTDEKRPCWPYDLDQHPDPPPQDMCTYESWADNSSIEETQYGRWECLVQLDVEWDEGNPHFLLGAPIDALQAEALAKLHKATSEKLARQVEDLREALSHIADLADDENHQWAYQTSAEFHAAVTIANRALG